MLRPSLLAVATLAAACAARGPSPQAGDEASPAADSAGAPDACVLPSDTVTRSSDRDAASRDAGPDAARTPDAARAHVADTAVAPATDAGSAGVFVAGLDHTGMARSPDGLSWGALFAGPDLGPMRDNAATGVAFRLGLVVTTGDAGLFTSRDRVYVSTDGQTWQRVRGTGDATHWHGLAFGRVAGGRELFFAAGDQWEFLAGADPVAAPRFKVSEDGMTWQYLAVHRDARAPARA